MKKVFEWRGRAVGVNKWLGSRRRGLRKKEEYEKFQNDLIWTLMTENEGTIETEVKVELDLIVDSRRDIDSLIKPVLDCLQKAEVIKNDKLVSILCVEKHYKARQGDEDVIKIKVKESS